MWSQLASSAAVLDTVAVLLVLVVVTVVVTVLVVALVRVLVTVVGTLLFACSWGRRLNCWSTEITFLGVARV